MLTVVFGPKLTSETLDLTFDFDSMLAVGETLASAVTTATVFSGEDSSPSSIIDGSATLDGTQVIQTVTDGVAGVVYVLNCAATTSAGQILIMQGRLAVISTNPFQ
jgi:hypothetical protein